MNWLFRPPSMDEVIRLLAAWRLWLLGALAGAVLASLWYVISPPPYRAQSTVLIDHNVELVIPEEESDTRRFYYLAEENDKLIQLAWSDKILAEVASTIGIPVEELVTDHLHLTQPGDGGWHFIADSPDPQEAVNIATTWASAFVGSLEQGGPGVNPIMQFSLVQGEHLQPGRAVPLAAFMFFGSLAGAAVLALLILFFHHKAG